MKHDLKRRLFRSAAGLMAGILSFSLATGTAFARDSVTTRKGVPPMYWMGYETPFTTNTPLTEARWKANIDWFAANFLPYGYDMVSTDGWIEGATMTNANGYILSYNDSWMTNDPASETVSGIDTWADWGGYVQSKGLQLGVYYNPLWVSPFAVEDTSKKVAGRPDISIRDIVDLTYDCDGDGIADGDRFNTGQPNPLYWVDVTKPGAEEYVKGYVNYFKSIGAKFLRVDFLSWYENGKEGTAPLTCKKDSNGSGYGRQKDHGRANYETALRWMSEAAGDDLTLSLVMPHLYNHGEIEKKYGDMIRIDEDVFGGGWDHISGRRQTWLNGWSQWANPFQGLTGFSDLAGRTSMINDADFLRMNTFSGPYADNERKSAVSLFTMAGAPITVADQYDTIGSSARFYQNPELIELSKSGFAGKPVYLSGAPYEPATNGQSDTGSRDTERWAGQLPNGDWVVGLFNRSDTNKTLSMNFESGLGLQTDALVRDLWTHQELGYKSSHSAVLAPHDSTVFKVIPKTLSRKYEAEAAALTGGASFSNDHTGYSAFGFAQKLDLPGAKATFAIEVPEAGTYKLNLRYANAKGADSTVTLRVEDTNKNQVASPRTVVLPNLPDWNTWADKKESVTLAKGLNLVQFDYTSGDNGGINLDYIELLGRTDNAAVNPGFETGGIDGWTEWHPDGQAAAYGVDSTDAHSGTNKLYFYAASKYKQSVHQTISGLANGTYVVSAWVKRQYAAPDVSRMEISQHGTPQVNVTINGSGEYEQIAATVPVTTGTLDVGFYVSSPGGTSLHIDDVRVERADIPLFNPDFANDYRHWSRKGDMVHSKIGSEAGGNKYADLYGIQPYTNDLFQYANLTAGTYTLQAKVRRSGAFNNAVIYADVAGQSFTAAVPASADWTTVTLPGIRVAGDGEAVKLGFWTDADAGSWLHIDDVKLVKNEPGQTSMGSYVSHAQQGNAVTFTLSHTPKVRIEFVKPEVAKVWMEPSGVFDKDSSFTVDSESSAPVSYTVSDQGGYIRLQSSGLTVRVNKSPFRIDYYDAANTSYITGERRAAGLAYGSGTRVYEYMNMDPGERFYGLGIDRDAQSLDKRGKRVVMDNVMSGGYGGNTSDISGTFFTSTKGYGIFFDNTYMNAAFDMGQESSDYYYFSAPEGEMVYYFINGPAMGDVLSAYADLTGKAPLPPKWALGYIQSKYGYKSWSEVNTIVDQFRSKGIPVDGMVLDVYWAAPNHYFDFTWNSADGFANPAANLAALRGKGIKVTNIVDPYVQQTASNYSDGSPNGYFAKQDGATKVYQAWYGPSGLIDYTNPAAANWFTNDPGHTKDVRQLWDDGVRGWWIDLNEPETPVNPADEFMRGTADKVHNVYALSEAKAFYDAQRSYADERVWNLARSGFSGIQQYGTTVWTGDVDASWDALTHNLQLGMSAGMSGIPYVATDTGGFNGKPSAELYTRWMQASAFMPVFRAHGCECGDPTNTREPWAFGATAEGIVKDVIKQRYRLLPYIYSAAKVAQANGTPLMKPLVMDYPGDANAANLQDQWMFGPSLLVAPVHAAGASSRSVYLPEGTWYDWSGANKWSGGQSITYSAPLETIPVLVKEGSIVPLGKDMNYVGETADDFINLKVYPLASGGSTSYSLYEDDGSTYGYESGSSATTAITVNKTGSAISLSIGASQGSYPGQPASRQWRSEVKTEAMNIVTVKRNGAELTKVNSFSEFNTGRDVWYSDAATGTIHIQTDFVPTSQAQAIELTNS